MMPKSGYRVSEKITLKQEARAKANSTQNHFALAKRLHQCSGRVMMRFMARDDSRDRSKDYSRDFGKTRRMPDAWSAAEKAFKAVTTKPVEGPPKAPPTLPGAKEPVTLRIDRDVLDFFQEEGPGWQDRINAALRKAAGK